MAAKCDRRSKEGNLFARFGQPLQHVWLCDPGFSASAFCACFLNIHDEVSPTPCCTSYEYRYRPQQLDIDGRRATFSQG